MSHPRNRAGEDPFGIASDTRFFIPFRTHERALTSLLAGVHGNVPLQALISTPGLGKSTLLARMLDKLPRHRYWAFRMCLPCSADEFYRYAITDLDGRPGDLPQEALRNKFCELILSMRAQYQGFLLMFDEAQNLSTPVLLEIPGLLARMRGAVNTIFAAQPNFLERVQAPEHTQLRECLDGNLYTLSKLTTDEVAEYITRRLHTAGSQALFSSDAIETVAQASTGIPRLINNICWNAISRGGSSQLYAMEDVQSALEAIPMEHEIQKVKFESRSLDSIDRCSSNGRNVDLASLLQTLLERVVCWTGTTGELLAEITSPGTAECITAGELLARLRSECAQLVDEGILVDVRNRDGLPPLIYLRKRDPIPFSGQASIPGPPALPPLSGQVSELPSSPPVVDDKRVDCDRPRRPKPFRALHMFALGFGAVAVFVVASVRATNEPPQRSMDIPTAITAPELSKKGTSTKADQVALERKLAEEGNAVAERNLGLRYLRGDYGAKDRQAGVMWLRRAALHQDAESQYLLALLLATSDKSEAYKWFILCHSAGHADCLEQSQRLTGQLTGTDIAKVRYELALAYADGRGVDADISKAYVWMLLAKSAGARNTDEQLRRMSQKMTNLQIADASNRATKWLSRTQPPALALKTVSTR